MEIKPTIAQVEFIRQISNLDPRHKAKSTVCYVRNNKIVRAMWQKWTMSCQFGVGA